MTHLVSNLLLISHGMSDLVYKHMSDKLMLHFPQIISLAQKDRHPVYDVLPLFGNDTARQLFIGLINFSVK